MNRHSAPPTLRDEAIDRINEHFYTADDGPAAYFRSRLELLLIGTQSREAQELRYGRLRLPSTDSLDDRFAHIEAIALLHQLTEATWSHLFAHEAPVICPAIYLAELSTQHWRKRVEQVLGAPDGALTLVRAALTGPDSVMSADDAERLDDRLPTAARLLAATARRYLGEGRLYNAIKHGAAADTTRSQISVEIDQDLELAHAGTWLSVLERAPADKARWRHVQVSTSVDQDLLLILCLIGVLGSVWQVAKARRGYDQGDVHLQLPTSERLDQALQAESGRIHKFVLDDLYAVNGTGTITVVCHA